MDSKLFSNVEVRKLDNAGKLKGTGKVLVANTLEVKFRVMEGPTGLFAALPSTKGKDGKYYNEVFIPDETTRKLFQEVVLEAYQANTSSAPKSKPKTSSLF